MHTEFKSSNSMSNNTESDALTEALVLFIVVIVRGVLERVVQDWCCAAVVAP
jgi:hypothetical protein